MRGGRPGWATLRAVALCVPLLSACAAGAPKTERAALAESIRGALAPQIAAGAADGSSLLIGLEALYAPLDARQRALLDEVRALAGAPEPPPADAIEWRRIEGQVVRGPAGETQLPVQLLPAPVWRAYDAMSRAMRADLGRRLLVGSGYRSPAYQLFVFVSYLPVADYSFEQTLRHVSLPSEHSRPSRQGLDFVSETGVDLEYAHPASFERLPEYAWLLANAARFGFAQSPPDEASAHSPWHWHYEPGLPGAPGEDARGARDPPSLRAN